MQKCGNAEMKNAGKQKCRNAEMQKCGHAEMQTCGNAEIREQLDLEHLNVKFASRMERDKKPTAPCFVLQIFTGCQGLPDASLNKRLLSMRIHRSGFMEISMKTHTFSMRVHE